MFQAKSAQRGFTLVEIAIVLIIIGLLLGAVLKGQEMIEQSKIKRVINDFNAISAAVMTYKDRYGHLPGDDPNAATRWPAATGRAGTANGNGNGVIDGTLGQVLTGGTNESGYAWQHLRLAGLIGGDVANAATARTPERTPFGSNYGLGSNGNAFGLGNTATIFCASLPAKAAEALDKQLDDGNPQSGNIRAGAPNANMNTAPAGTANTTVYVDNPTAPWYTVCRRL
jgi:prepilin-type N-terminal cleavage/methylation domain-containing protein